MKVIAVDDMVPGERLAHPIYHESGRLLLAAGRTLEAEHVFSLRTAGIERAFLCDGDDDVVRLRSVSGRQSVDIDSLALNEPLGHAIFDEDGIILLSKGQVLKPSYVAVLKRRGLTEVFTDPLTKTFEVEKFNLEILRGVAKQLEERIETERDLRVLPDGKPFADLFRRQKARFSTDEKDSLLSDRRSTVARADELLKTLASGRAVAGGLTSEAVDALAHHILENPNLLLGVTFFREHDDYLAEHAVGVCSVALAMGTTLGYSERQVKELALAAFLADLGMIRVPDQILKKPGSLTADEFREIRKHPIHGLNMLQQFSAIPDVVGLAVYQSHERDDGSGYPRQRRGPQIHDYARVLAVADMFVAMGSQRNHRPAMSPYQSIETLIRMASKRIIDPDMVRILLRSISLYPIGSWVELNTREIGRVIASGGEAFDRPTINVLFDRSKRPLAAGRILDLREKPHVKVVRMIDATPNGLDGPVTGF